MEAALTYFGASVFLLTVLTILFRVEDAYGDKIILSSIRSSLDKLIVFIKNKIVDIFMGDKLHKLKLVWHFLLHKLLKRLQNFFNFVNKKVQVLQNKNKEAARAVSGIEKNNHLNQIAEHKEKTALSDSEKKKRKSHD